MKDDVDRQKENERRAAKRKRLATERTRRYRERKAEELSIAPTPYTNEIVALLLDLGWLPLEKSEDARSIGEAIFMMLSDTAKNR